MSKPNTVLVLRTCNADMSSSNDFQWPEEGPVSCEDWDPSPVCGGGLHGLLKGEGAGSLLDWSENAKWLLVEVEETDVIDLGGKIKFPKGIVVYCGEKNEAIERLVAEYPDAAVVGKIATAGYRGHAIAGVRGQATAGDYGHATAGDSGQAIAGYGGHATAGDDGHATAGVRGHATAGDHGQATAGDFGHAIAGDGGHAIAGAKGEIQVRYWDGDRYRTKIGFIGENGLKPNVPYRLNKKHEFEEKDDKKT